MTFSNYHIGWIILYVFPSKLITEYNLFPQLREGKPEICAIPNKNAYLMMYAVGLCYSECIHLL